MTVAAHAAVKSDAVTRWWRRLSLRAKVTGVTVAVLAIGLIITGVGTMVFLRTTLIANLDANLEQSVTTDLASSLFEMSADADGGMSFELNRTAPPTEAFVALYGPTGELEIASGGNGGESPVWPESFRLDQALAKGRTPFDLSGAEGGRFHASVDTKQLSGTIDYYTQMVALPLRPINQTVASYTGIFSFLALITLVAAALLTRSIVTLTFRSLGQVESTAMSIAAGDLTQRMTDIEPRTEVGKLKIAINAMLSRVDSALSQRDATVRQMRRFIGDASHELRTPLVTVRGYAELYRMGAISKPEDIAQSMERIEKEAIRMGMLVEDLLALARLDERRDLDFTPVDLRLVARDAAMDMRAAAPDRTITVVDATTAPVPPPIEVVAHAAPETPSPNARKRTSGPGSALAGAGRLLRRKPRTAESHVPVAHLMEPSTPTFLEPLVLGDENRIRQVVTNILGNARRYTPAESPIEIAVGVDMDAEMGWISVIDHGEGVPEQLRDKVFQRFWRADTSRARETGGSGLGLAIVASIVEALHGSIEVVETPGGGATFRVAFPLTQRRDASEHLDIETRPLPRLGERLV